MSSFVYLFIFISLSSTQDAEIEDKTSLFNDKLIEKIEAEDVARFYSFNRLDEIRHRIGILGVYFRAYKALLPMNPDSGFENIYPSQVEFHSELATTCSSGLEECLDYIEEYLRKAQPWLTGEDGAHEETEMSKGRLEKVLCWLTMREIEVFDRIPFCRYSLDNVNASYRSQIIWPAKLFHSNLDFLDEFAGEPFDCSRKSFCPDPCCLSIDPNHLNFTDKKCHLNLCRNPSLCRLNSKLNDDLPAQRDNRWNVSCPCQKGQFFRSDVAQCVHENVCAKEEKCRENEDCLNILGDKGYKCICRLGFIKGPSRCISYNFSSYDWDGPAVLESSSAVLPFILPLFLVFFLL